MRPKQLIVVLLLGQMAAAQTTQMTPDQMRARQEVMNAKGQIQKIAALERQVSERDRSIDELTKLVDELTGKRDKTIEDLKTQLRAREDQIEKLIAILKSVGVADAKPAVEDFTSPIAAKLLEKTFTDSDVTRGNYTPAKIWFKTKIRNNLDYAVNGIEGELEFTDTFGNVIFGSMVTVEKTIASGGEIDWAGHFEYKQLEEDHRALRDADPFRLRLVLRPTRVIKMGGSIEKFEDK